MSLHWIMTCHLVAWHMSGSLTSKLSTACHDNSDDFDLKVASLRCYMQQQAAAIRRQRFRPFLPHYRQMTAASACWGTCELSQGSGGVASKAHYGDRHIWQGAVECLPGKSTRRDTVLSPHAVENKSQATVCCVVTELRRAGSY